MMPALTSLFVLTLLADPAVATEMSRPPAACVPAEVMAVMFSTPAPVEEAAAGQATSIDRLAGWVIALKAMGVIPREGRVLADIASTLPLVAKRPYALMLMDITSRQVSEEVYRLNDLRAALVLETRGADEAFDRRVRDLLATYSDSVHGHIQALDVEGVTFYRLTDDRLPGWAVTEWGTLDGRLVIGFGSGAFDAVRRTIIGASPALATTEFYARARAALTVNDSGLDVYVDFERIRRRVGEVVEGRPTEVLRAVGLEKARQLLWTVGFQGRALRSEAFARGEDGKDVRGVLAAPELLAPEVAAVIPTGAHGYAGFRFDLESAVRGLRGAWLAGQAPGRQERVLSGWAMLEEKYGFDVDQGLVQQLGDHLVIHDWPAHPLGLPLPGTFWIQTDGPTDVIAATVDGMMRAWQESMEAGTTTRPSGVSPRVRRDPDGTWYLQLGLLGPALRVTDGWIVIGHSPEAVRQNVAWLEAHGAEAPP